MPIDIVKMGIFVWQNVWPIGLPGGWIYWRVTGALLY